MDHSPMPPARPADISAHAPVRWGAVASIVGFLALVEITSGILQGYYTPLMTDIARHLGIHDADVNWFEAAQLMVSALAVPLLASLGDIFGHKRMLLVSAIVTAAASWAVVFAGSFTTFLIAWAFQGFYAVWLPLEIAIVFSRARKLGAPGPITRRTAGLLVGALQFGVIAGALAGGALIGLFGGNLALTMVVPAVATTLCVFAVGFGVPDDGARNGAKIDGGGFGYLAVGLLLLTSGLSFLRINGPASPLVWGCLALGLAVLYVFYRHENKQADPLIDFKVLFARSMWPLQLTAGLFGVSVLGAQIPMSTFARTDPAVNGYGLGMSASGVSIIIGAYVLSLLIGALLFPPAARLLGTRATLVAASTLIGIGYLMFLPLHGSLAQVLTNMVVAGLGSGALVAALPAAAAAAAPFHRTGMATGLTNAVKTIGGSFASAIFGLALIGQAAGVVGEGGAESFAAPLAGYMIVWGICGGTAIVCALALLAVPRGALEDTPLHVDGTGS
ncbi:MFS transporter [Paeniglutamicibacter kerguelensis]|uniref:MFS family permease n=1 Tax=Paeniglutamicibacter kerguelensis TaxID=254788 RepID=A0ABS4XB91_9MICC|nr:MFS transporter [Paeniglutamicibacter kerguelensis]MBP2385523.1 MFS family permease [Paeniglutamicibacter kerguelensis]